MNARMRRPQSRHDSAVASLGQMVVSAPRTVKMGVLVVTAARETNATVAKLVANLGTMTVSAGREALIADLGNMIGDRASQGTVIDRRTRHFPPPGTRLSHA